MKSFDDVIWSIIRNMPSGWRLGIEVRHGKHSIKLMGPDGKKYLGKHGTLFADQVQMLLGIANAEARKAEKQPQPNG